MLTVSVKTNAAFKTVSSSSNATLDSQVEQLPSLFKAARGQDATSRAELTNTLKVILERPLELAEQKEARASYLVQMIEAYYRLFPCCLTDYEEMRLLKESLYQTVQRLVQMPLAVIEEEYSRLNRNSYNQPLKQLVFRFSRTENMHEPEALPALEEAECLLALFLQCLRQQLGAAVLLSNRFQVEYRDLIRSACMAASEPEVCQNNLIGWLWEAMKSFDPLKAFGATGHGRPTFEAWVRTVISNKLADEKRKLLKREADELLFYEPRAAKIFQDRHNILPSLVQAELNLPACLQFITVVQTQVTDPRIRTTTSRLRHRVAQLLAWSIDYTRDVHQQVRRILGRYVQSTRSLNITSADSNQEWIDNYPDIRTIANPAVHSLDCIGEFLNDAKTPGWVQDWCEKRRTQAEIARELYVSQPTISRCLGREYRLWLYRRFFLDTQTPSWMKRWYDTHDIQSPHQRRQLRRELHPEYAQGLYSAKTIDAKIELMLQDWCSRNGIYYLA